MWPEHLKETYILSEIEYTMKKVLFINVYILCDINKNKKYLLEFSTDKLFTLRTTLALRVSTGGSKVYLTKI